MQTIIARLTDLKKYDRKNKTITWSDNNQSTWDSTYSKLNINDNVIFISNQK